MLLTRLFRTQNETSQDRAPNSVPFHIWGIINLTAGVNLTLGDVRSEAVSPQRNLAVFVGSVWVITKGLSIRPNPRGQRDPKGQLHPQVAKQRRTECQMSQGLQEEIVGPLIFPLSFISVYVFLM